MLTSMGGRGTRSRELCTSRKETLIALRMYTTFIVAIVTWIPRACVPAMLPPCQRGLYNWGAHVHVHFHLPFTALIFCLVKYL